MHDKNPQPADAARQNGLTNETFYGRRFAFLRLLRSLGGPRPRTSTWRGFCAGILRFDRELGLFDSAAESRRRREYMSRPQDRIGSACIRICDVGRVCSRQGRDRHECPDIPTECSEVKQILSIRRIRRSDAVTIASTCSRTGEGSR